MNGYGKAVEICGLDLLINPLSQASDAAPINLQNRADDWRIVNCKLSWPWTRNTNGNLNETSRGWHSELWRPCASLWLLDPGRLG